MVVQKGPCSKNLYGGGKSARTASYRDRKHLNLKNSPPWHISRYRHSERGGDHQVVWFDWSSAVQMPVTPVLS